MGILKKISDVKTKQEQFSIEETKPNHLIMEEK